MFKTNLEAFTGRSFLIITDNENEHLRINQPCYGELRKYEGTHVGDCTQPKNTKPGDLHYPFPSGTPTGLVISLKNMIPHGGDDASDVVIETIFSDTSPWLSGFKQVEFIKGENNHIQFVKLDNMEIDTTVLVNLLKNLSPMLTNRNEFCKLIDFEYDKNVILALYVNNGGFRIENGIYKPNTYSAAKIFSVRRFFEQTPNDLTGGFLKDRVDYNRTSMQDVFLGEESKGGIEWQKYMVAKGLPSYTGYQKVLDLKVHKERIHDVLYSLKDNEDKPEQTRFIWTTTSGRTNG